MSVDWVTCGDDHHWCSFVDVDLADVEASGVYVVWADHKIIGYRAVRVGQGVIEERIREHRNDEEITSYKRFGPMYITWASIPSSLVDGAEAFLADHYKPLIGSRFPDAPFVKVNLPW